MLGLVCGLGNIDIGLVKVGLGFGDIVRGVHNNYSSSFICFLNGNVLIIGEFIEGS